MFSVVFLFSPVRLTSTTHMREICLNFVCLIVKGGKWGYYEGEMGTAQLLWCFNQVISHYGSKLHYILTFHWEQFCTVRVVLCASTTLDRKLLDIRIRSWTNLNFVDARGIAILRDVQWISTFSPGMVAHAWTFSVAIGVTAPVVSMVRIAHWMSQDVLQLNSIQATERMWRGLEHLQVNIIR